MGMSRCYSLMKCLLILFNIIFLCVGSSACGFAAWALWDGRGNESGAARAGLLAVAAWGAALALGALAALCGAARSSAPLLAAAFSLLALTGVAEAAAAWWGAAHRPELRRALHEALEHTVRHEYGVLPSRTQLSTKEGVESRATCQKGFVSGRSAVGTRVAVSGVGRDPGAWSAPPL